MSGIALSRRRFVQGALAGGALLWASPSSLLRSARAALAGSPLPIPEQLTGASIELVARVADIPILDGSPTRMWTFNGTFPGPTIRRPVGAETRVTVVNDLPEAAGSLTIHHHGGHQASIHDGGPHPDLAIANGSSREYVYPLDEPGALQWYHDHSHFRTGRNTWMGLMGLFLVDDPDEDARLGLPVGDDDIPLVICDRRFDDQNQLVEPFTAPHREDAGPTETVGAGWPPGDEIAGDVYLVNGVVEPYLDVEARRYRFRILNASNFRVYNLMLDTGASMVQIGTESGLLPAPVDRTSVALGPGERVEVVVDFTRYAGQDVHLVATDATLMRFRVGGAASGAGAPPAELRALPQWVNDLSHVPDRTWVFSLGADTGGRPAWTINGQAFDHCRVDARPELDSTETWLFVNAGPTAMTHYVHIHDVDWFVLSRNGVVPEPAEAGLKETFRLDPGESLLVGTKFTDYLGRFMIHCHMLEHEDHGMMATFEVVPPGQGDRLLAKADAAAPAQGAGTEPFVCELPQSAEV